MEPREAENADQGYTIGLGDVKFKPGSLRSVRLRRTPVGMTEKV
jgi:hypothetical protein